MPVPELPASIQAALEQGEGVLDELRSLALFDALGLPTVRREVLGDRPWRYSLEGPVAAKLISADLPHKTEAGAVTLGLNDLASLERAADAMHERARQYRPDARIEGVLIQEMVTGGMAEVLLGYRDDASLGPLITLGVGGRLAEVYKDAATRVAPIGLEDARDMIASVRGLAVIRGWRGQPAGDLEGLAQAIVAMSALASLPGQPVAEAEINPLIVARDRVTAVDGLVVLKPRR
jgi:hypothetical protein